MMIKMLLLLRWSELLRLTWSRQPSERPKKVLRVPVEAWLGAFLFFGLCVGLGCLPACLLFCLGV